MTALVTHVNSAHSGIPHRMARIKTLLRGVFDSLFSCWHRRYGWPHQDDEGNIYVVCEGCKERLPYDWDRMRVVRDRSYYVVSRVETDVSGEHDSVCGNDVGGSVSTGSRAVV